MLPHRIRTYSVTTALCLGLIPFICNYTYPNNAYEPMSRFLDKKIESHGKKLSKVELSSVWSTLVSLGFLGSAVSFLFGPIMSDRYGRKATILICMIAAIPARFLSVVSPYGPLWPCLFIGQFISCFLSGIINQALPVTLCEIAEPRIRGKLGMSLVATYSASLLLSATLGLEELFGTDERWSYAYILFLGLGCIPLPILFWMKESPVFLAARGDYSEMIQSLEFYRGSTSDLGQVKADAEHSEPREKGRFSRFRVVRFFMDPALRKPIVLTVVVSVSCVLMDFVQAYSTLFLLKAGMNNVQATWSTLAMRGVVVLMTFLFVFIAEKISGRAHFLSGTWAAAIGMLAFCPFQMGYEETGMSVFTILFTISVVIQQAGASFGVRPQFWFLVAEMFPHHLRSTAKAFSLLCLSLGGVLFSSIFVPLLEVIEGWAYLPLGIFATACAIYVHLYLPETRGKDLSKIYEDLERAKAQKKRKKRPPSLYRELTETPDSEKLDNEAAELLPSEFFGESGKVIE